MECPQCGSRNVAVVTVATTITWWEETCESRVQKRDGEAHSDYVCADCGYEWRTNRRGGGLEGNVGKLRIVARESSDDPPLGVIIDVYHREELVGAFTVWYEDLE